MIYCSRLVWTHVTTAKYSDITQYCLFRWYIILYYYYNILYYDDRLLEKSVISVVKNKNDQA